MLKVLAISLGVCFLAGAAMAADKKIDRTPEQKALLKELTEKYDKNKDGKLDADERGAMTAEDKAKLAKAGLGGGKKK